MSRQYLCVSPLAGAVFFGFDHSGERSTHCLPALCFESTVGVYPQPIGGQVSRGLLHELDDLFLCWNVGRMDVVDTRASLIGIGEFLESVEQCHVRSGRLDGGHVGVHVGDRFDDVVERQIAHIRVNLDFVRDAAAGACYPAWQKGCSQTDPYRYSRA